MRGNRDAKMSSLAGVTDAQFWARVDRLLATIPLPANRTTTLSYLQERKAIGIRMSTLMIDANALRGFMLHLDGKAVTGATRQDVIAYVNNAQKVRGYRSARRDGSATVTERPVTLGPRTLAQRKEVLRPFFKWLRGEDEDPPETKGLKVRRVEDHIPTDQLLTRDDLHKLLIAGLDPQEKARVALLYESGFRAGEFVALNLSSVEFEELEDGVWSAVVTLPKGVPGLKTGARRIRVFDSVPYLRAWIEAHPRKKEPSAPLWLTWSRRAPGARMTANALLVWSHRIAKRAGIAKDIHPHVWRHSAATERARLGWNEAQMRAYFGWTRNSDMPSVYTHLAGLDCDDMELERRGLKARGRAAGTPALTGRTCRYCQLRNEATASFCARCHRPIGPDAEAAIEAKKKAALIGEAKSLLAGIDPEHLAALYRDLVIKPRA